MSCDVKRLQSTTVHQDGQEIHPDLCVQSVGDIKLVVINKYDSI